MARQTRSSLRNRESLADGETDIRAHGTIKKASLTRKSPKPDQFVPSTTIDTDPHTQSNQDDISARDSTTDDRVRVIIPAPNSYTKNTRSGTTSAMSRSSTSSLSEARDSSALDTPATSLDVTPDISVDGRAAKSRKRSRLSYESTAGDEALESEDADARLARELQEEEYEKEVYGATQPSRKKQARSTHRNIPVETNLADEIPDSDDALSSVVSFSDEDLEARQPTRKGKGKARAVVIDSDDEGEEEYAEAETDYERGLARARAGKKSTKAPTREAGAIAQKSVRKALQSFVVPDSDSEMSALTEMDSESAFESADAAEEVTDDEASESDVPLASLRAARDSGDVTSAATASTRTPAQPRSSRGRRRHHGRTMNDDRGNSLRETRSIRERKKLEKSHPQIMTMWDTLEATPIIKPVQAPQPEGINRKLKSFQLEGIDWMMKQERTHYRGGLLGDEMGMGKTIQAVSLIMSDYPAKQPSLVLVPPVALMQWATEIKEYTDGKLKVLIFHGQNSKTKGITVKELKKYDVIMISYNSLESLHRKETKGWTRGDEIIKEASPIHAIHFHRLILDEAHSIKQRTTGVAKACFALKGSYKWCLSGTPVQNRIGEFFSLLRFLEVRPFADYFCKKCSCAMIHWEVDASHRCKACNHNGMEHVSVFNQELLNPLTQSDDAAERSRAMDKLHMITARIMLRRVKRDHTSSMELPPKEVIVHNEFFGEIERDFSSSIMSNTNRKFDTYVSQGVVLNNYANIFGLIMQMRQVANHPDLLLKKHSAQGQNVLVCNICDEVAEDAIRSKCKHDFCRSCIKNFAQSVESEGGEADCPRCHIPLAIDFDQPEIEQDEEDVKKSSIINRIKMENWTSSTKIEMLVYDLYKLRSKKQTLKSIVFSQFTSMLQLIEWRLRRAGFNTVMLDGSMTPMQRQRSIEHFMTNPECEVFLVSLKAGGVALNLTEASRVFIVDPWWNPAAEWQSADRCHRIGQKRPCVITRLCIEDSVESRMVMLQEKKANMIHGTINNDKVAMEKLTPEDMQFLFRGS